MNEMVVIAGVGGFILGFVMASSVALIMVNSYYHKTKRIILEVSKKKVLTNKQIVKFMYDNGWRATGSVRMYSNRQAKEKQGKKIAEMDDRYEN